MSKNSGIHRSIALVGPSGAGKTSLLESLAFVSGAVKRKAEIGSGQSVGDLTAEARAQHMTTELNVLSLRDDTGSLTIIDCPGSVEFVQETRNSLIGVDAAVIVLEPGIERMVAMAPTIHFLEQHHIPHLFFINKMDRSQERYRDLLDAIRAQSARPVVPHEYAIGRNESLVGYIDLVTEEAYGYVDGGPSEVIPLPEDHREREENARTEMLETLADFDDDLMELLLDDAVPPADDILRNLQKTLGTDQICPVYMGVAAEDKGVRRLLEAIRRLIPAGEAMALARGLTPEADTCVQVLKTWHSAHAGKMSLVRVWSGALAESDMLNGQRFASIIQFPGGRPSGVSGAAAGQIVGLGRMEHVKTGDILSTGKTAPDLPVNPVIEPMYSLALATKDRKDDVKLSDAFTKLTEEDPSVIYAHDPETGQTVLQGQGDIHLRTILARLSGRYGVEVTTGEPDTAYRETIRVAGDAHGRHKKQSGGHGQFGDVKIRIKPLKRGEGFQFENQIVGGSIPKQYIPAVEAGARDCLSRGPLAGYPVVDLGITVYDGQHHSVDSSEMAFRQAAALALREGLPGCRPVLLEPVCTVHISVPSEYTSRVLQVISGKRGQIMGYDTKVGWHGWDEVEGQLPQAELHDLIISLRSLTQGVAFYTAHFDHMEEAPERVTKDVMARAEA